MWASRTAGIMEAPIRALMSSVKVPENPINMGQGTPFFPPPTSAVMAVEKALRDGLAHTYIKDEGLDELRLAIVSKLREQNNISVDAEENVLVVGGGNQAFMNAVMAVTDVGDDLIILAPYYFNHRMAVEMAGCRVKIVGCGEDYMPVIEDIEGAIGPRTRAILTVSPNNPTGAVYPEEIQKAINEVCASHGLYHITDEAYEHFTYGSAKHVSPLRYDRELEHTIALFSFSKSYSMAGFRIGYMVYPNHLHKEMLKVQDTLAICAPTPSQYAALAVLENEPLYPKQYLPHLERSGNAIFDGLMDCPYINLTKGEGAFYFMGHLEPGPEPIDVVRTLIERYGIITVPGTVFGMADGWVRLSYGGLKPQKAVEAAERLSIALEEIYKGV